MHKKAPPSGPYTGPVPDELAAEWDDQAWEPPGPYKKQRHLDGGMRHDPGWALVAALEIFDEDTGTATKAPIFSTDLLTPPVERTTADTPAAHSQGGSGLAQHMIAGKIANCRTLLRRNARTDVTTTVARLKQLSGDARECSNFATLLGIEGTAARLYFAEFPKMLSGACAEFAAQFSAAGRNRRPPPDPLNALLSFCYSMLTKDLVAVTLSVGLDPYLGVFHRSRYSRPALALDLAEEFRPLIADSVVVSVLNNGEIGPRDFIRRGGAVALTSDGRKAVLKAYERRLDTKVRHPVFGYQISYRRVLDVQARLLAAQSFARQNLRWTRTPPEFRRDAARSTPPL